MIAIVIVNYRTPELVVECLSSLQSELNDGCRFRVFIGDAASGDGSVETINDAILKYGWSEWAICDDIGENGGFAFGNNFLLMKRVLHDLSYKYVHFLNPDTFIRPGAVKALVEFLEAHPNAGLAGSRLENADGSPRAFAFRFPTPGREFVRGLNSAFLDRFLPSARTKMQTPMSRCRVDWVSGASFMIRFRLLASVGLMDPDYFLYFEETDLMARVHDAGEEIWHVPESRVVHLAGQSTGVRNDNDQSFQPSPYWYASRRRYFRKHFGVIGALLADAAYVTGSQINWLGRTFRGRSRAGAHPVWAEYVAPWLQRGK